MNSAFRSHISALRLHRARPWWIQIPKIRKNPTQRDLRTPLQRRSRVRSLEPCYRVEMVGENVITQNDSSWSYLDFVKFSAFWGLIWSELICGRAWSPICQSCGFSEDFAKWKAQEEQREKREALGKNCIGTAVLLPEDSCQLWGFQSHQMSEVLCFPNCKSIGSGTPLALCQKNNLNRQNCAKSQMSSFLSWLFSCVILRHCLWHEWEICAPGAVEDLAQGVRVATSSYGHRSVLGHIEGPEDGDAEKPRFVGSVKMWEVASCPRETAQKNCI